MASTIPYKSFCWSLGTTSFRTKYFNRTIEEQLALLDKFWSNEENSQQNWAGNNTLQTAYYDFMKSENFVDGTAGNKPKDAREKTSGLVDIGLIDEGRRLTAVGQALLDISLDGDFSTDNYFQIPKDSYIYLKQLLKTSNQINDSTVRPFIVLLYLLSQVETLSNDEFKFLLPLCTSRENTEQILQGIKHIRRGENTIDDIIIDRLMSMNNYKEALLLLLQNNVTEELLCEIGLNRKSRSYDAVYYELYNHLYSLYVNNDIQAAPLVFDATKNVKIGLWWRKYIFNTLSKTAIKRNLSDKINATLFDNVNNEEEFKVAFFKVMHLMKAKATLSDYYDLNCRYIKTSDIVLFEDSTVKLDIVPKYFFNAVIDELYQEAYTASDKLFENCELTDISACLVFDDNAIISGINSEFGTSVATIDAARIAVDDNRYRRLQTLIDNKFTDDKLLQLLDLFEQRNDDEIRNMVTDNADVPTMFEYVIGILWYKASERQGKILEYMKLSLDADLLPKTHAAGGEADIVYEYEQTSYYPEHTLLLEVTLADSTNQRRMEMEPVSRHLGEHILKYENNNSYCVFSTTYLDRNVISDFRNRKTFSYYNKDFTKSVDGMKIIPLQTTELKTIIRNRLNYRTLYPIFDNAFNSNEPVPSWYQNCISNKL